MKDVKEIPNVFQVSIFLQASGPKLNLTKCELMSIHPTHLKEIHYLGILISKSPDEREKPNVLKVIEKCQFKLSL